MSKAEELLKNIAKNLSTLEEVNSNVYYVSSTDSTVSFKTFEEMEAMAERKYSEITTNGDLSLKYPNGVFNASIFLGASEDSFSSEMFTQPTIATEQLISTLLTDIQAVDATILRIAVKVISAEWQIAGVVVESGTTKLVRSINFKGKLYYEIPV